MPKRTRNLNDYVVPLNMNGLQGRMLELPASKLKTRKILFIYGHHASLERFFGLAEALNDYGAVTMPDLPGFGGMDSFYKIGEKPSLNNLADYLASFIKLRYRRQRVTVVGYSFGFTVVTRMLQRYPELADKVDLLVSAVGFARGDDFKFSPSRRLYYRFMAKVFSYKLPSLIFRNIALHPSLIQAFYARTHNAKAKFNGLSEEEQRLAIDFEVHLWRINDVRTYMNTTLSMLKLDNCRQKVNLPLWHIAVKADNYFDNHLVEQHLKVIFSGLSKATARLGKHSMTVIASKKEAKVFLPPPLCKLLAKQP